MFLFVLCLSTQQLMGTKPKACGKELRGKALTTLPYIAATQDDTSLASCFPMLISKYSTSIYLQFTYTSSSFVDCLEHLPFFVLRLLMTDSTSSHNQPLTIFDFVVVAAAAAVMSCVRMSFYLLALFANKPRSHFSWNTFQIHASSFLLALKSLQ